MSSRRRHAGVTQSQYSSAQPIQTSYLSVPQWGSGNFVHPDPFSDNSIDATMAPPPTTLSLPVTNHAEQYNANTLLYSPVSDGYSQTQSQETYMLPSYGNSLLGSGANDWNAKMDPDLYKPALSPSEAPLTPHTPLNEKFEHGTPESEVKIKDLSIHAHHSSTSNMTPKQRAVHRKAIEEKSSMKRKLAEQRLSKAVTTRLGGTFVPGLANQMNQAADLIEKDAATINALEAELARLRKYHNADVQMKYRS